MSLSLRPYCHKKEKVKEANLFTIENNTSTV